jgi:hypothetical protein
MTDLAVLTRSKQYTLLFFNRLIPGPHNLTETTMRKVFKHLALTGAMTLAMSISSVSAQTVLTMSAGLAPITP